MPLTEFLSGADRKEKLWGSTEQRQSKHVLVLKLLNQIFAHEGFVKACPVGWIHRERESEGIFLLFIFYLGR